MKYFVTVALVSLSIFSSAQAGEISKEKYREMMIENRSAYESVMPGMFALTVGVQSVVTDELGQEFKCRQAIESTVMQVYGTKYLTHEKTKNLNDCGGHQVEGEENEYLQWNKVFTVEEHLNMLDSRFMVAEFKEKDSFVQMTGITKYSDNREPKIFTRHSNIIESQFYSIKAFNDDVFTWVQYYTRQVDPNSINIDGLEIINE